MEHTVEQSGYSDEFWWVIENLTTRLLDDPLELLLFIEESTGISALKSEAD